MTTLEDVVPDDHPLRAIRSLVDAALSEIKPSLDALCAEGGRPSIAPQYLLRAQLVQILYVIPSGGGWSNSCATTCSCAGSSACRSMRPSSMRPA